MQIDKQEVVRAISAIRHALGSPSVPGLLDCRRNRKGEPDDRAYDILRKLDGALKDLDAALHAACEADRRQVQP